MNLDQMYQEIILDHYKHPHGRGLRDPFQAEVHHINPTCGDEITLQVHLDGDRIDRVRWEGDGCAISQASASILADLAPGFYRARVRSPEGATAENVVEISPGEHEHVALAAPPQEESAVVREVVDRAKLTVQKDNTLDVSDGAPVASPQLSTLLTLAAARSSGTHSGAAGRLAAFRTIWYSQPRRCLTSEPRFRATNALRNACWTTSSLRPSEHSPRANTSSSGR